MPNTHSETGPSTASDAHHDHKDASSPSSSSPSSSSAWRSALPDWIVDNLTTPRGWRIWFRCWLAAWAGLVLMIPQRSLQVLGQAAFFSAMVIFMVPPTMPLVISVMLYAIIGVGASLGWAWGAAAMAAADAARDQAVNQQRLLIAQQSVSGATNPEAQYSALIFQGNFLDTKSTAVFGVFLCVLAYFGGVVQVKLPKLKMGAIFCLIIADIFASYGPLFPFPKYILGTTFMIPLSCGIAIALAAQLLVFPETLHYAWQLQLMKLLGLNVKLLASHQAALEQSGDVHEDKDVTDANDDDADLEVFQQLAKQGKQQIASIARKHQETVRKLHLGIVGLSGSLADQAPMLELELTYSRLSSKDLRTFVLPIRKLTVRILSLNAFWKHLSDESGIHAADQYRTDQHHDDIDAAQRRRDSDFDEKHNLRPTRVHESQTLRRIRRRVLEAEAEQHVSLASLVRILSRVTARPIAANRSALSAVLAYIQTTANWKKAPTFDELLEKLYESQRELEQARQQLLTDERLKLLQPYIDHFRSTRGGDSSSATGASPDFLDSHISLLQLRIGGRPFFVSLVFLTNLFDVIESTLGLQRSTIALAEKRGAKNKVWMPTGLRSIWKILGGKKGAHDLCQLSSSSSGNGNGNADGFERTEEIDDDLQDEDRRRRLDDDEEEEAGAGSGRSSSTRSSSRRYSSDSDDEDDDNEGPERTGTTSNGSSEQQDAEKGLAAAPTSRSSGNERKAAAKKRGKKQSRSYSRDPDALPPTSVLHRIGRLLGAAYYFAWSPAGVFGLRMAIATFAVWIVAVLPSTAAFSYQNRGVWALIMAQTGLALHGGELIFSLATRLLGTVLGAVVGMLIWYCSTGSGQGNPYGLAAAAAVGFAPLIFLRAFAPMALLLPMLMFGVTTCLIVGYSWIDSHLAVLANSGIGVDVAWRRALLVLIGMGVAFVVMIFPRLSSTRSMVRLGFARNTREINALWCLVVEQWLRNTREDRMEQAGTGFRNVVLNGEDGSTSAQQQQQQSKKKASTSSSSGNVSSLSSSIRSQFVASQVRLATLSQQIGLASLDLQLRGRWPKERYVELLSIQSMLLESLMQLFISIDALQVSSELGSADLGVKESERHKVWRNRLVRDTGFLSPQFVSEVCLTLDLLGKSLRSGERLSHAQFGVVENLTRYGWVSREIDRRRRAEQQTGGEDLVTLDTLMDPLFMRYITASMSTLTLAAQLDKFREVVKDLVGQVPLPGFDAHKDEFEEWAPLLFTKH